MQSLDFYFRDEKVRFIADEQGNPWLVAKDVCGVLGIVNVSDALMALDQDEKSNIGISDVNNDSGHLRKYRIISESGLYKLVFRSNKPKAKRFVKWVTSEVLPTIRKTGKFSTVDQAISEMSLDEIKGIIYNPDVIIGLATRVKDLAEENRILKPKADTFDILMETDDALTMGMVAKVLHREFHIGRNRLFSILREHGILMANNEPKQQ